LKTLKYFVRHSLLKPVIVSQIISIIFKWNSPRLKFCVLFYIEHFQIKTIITLKGAPSCQRVSNHTTGKPLKAFSPHSYSPLSKTLPQHIPTNHPYVGYIQKDKNENCDRALCDSAVWWISALRLSFSAISCSRIFKMLNAESRHDKKTMLQISLQKLYSVHCKRKT
jgi:hypothetical protein